jgi:hypothetical protein
LKVFPLKNQFENTQRRKIPYEALKKMLVKKIIKNQSQFLIFELVEK